VIAFFASITVRRSPKGTPEEVANNKAVIEAYLGKE